MKKLTNKVLLGTGLFIIIAGTILMLHLKSAITEHKEKKVNQSKEEIQTKFESKTISKNYNFDNFNQVDLRCNCNSVIKYKDTYEVKVEAPREVIDSKLLEVATEGETLKIISSDWHNEVDSSKIKVVVFMPSITKLDISKSVSVKLSDFELDDLDIQMAGACKIDAENNNIDNLVLQSFGSSQALFKGSKVKNAKINAFGSSFVSITMDGGTLEGSIFGSGEVVYYGKLEKKDINTIGSTQVIHK